MIEINKSSVKKGFWYDQELKSIHMLQFGRKKDQINIGIPSKNISWLKKCYGIVVQDSRAFAKKGNSFLRSASVTRFMCQKKLEVHI